MSPLVVHFVWSPRKREKDRIDSRGDQREGQGRKRNRNEREETEEIKTFQSTLTLPNCKQISVGCHRKIHNTFATPNYLLVS